MISHVQSCWIHVSPLSYFCLWIWYTQAANNNPWVSCVWVKEKEMRENARHQSNPQVCLVILNRKIAMIAEHQQWKMEKNATTRLMTQSRCTPPTCGSLKPCGQSSVCWVDEDGKTSFGFNRMKSCQVQMISHVQSCWIHVSPLSYFCLWIWYTQAANNNPWVSCVWVKEKKCGRMQDINPIPRSVWSYWTERLLWLLNISSGKWKKMQRPVWWHSHGAPLQHVALSNHAASPLSAE